ncbi:MAG: biopolymer transporter ExbD [Candidatus Omnitrophica bacterium]|nr:biopolymer transporter ExbD [Candidatus Omnitrophota bacterium]
MKSLRARKQTLIAEINITPFTDVILVLLIIFMITTPLIMQSSIKVNAPKAVNAKPLKAAKSQATITVNAENLVYLDDKLVTKKELRERIAQLHNDNPDLEVVLFADNMVRFKDIVAVLDAVNDLGIKNLNIASGTE